MYLRWFVACKGDYLGCVKPNTLMMARTATNSSYDHGITIGPGAAMSYGKTFPIYFSHEGYRGKAHDMRAARRKDVFIASPVETLPPGVIPEGVLPAVINFVSFLSVSTHPLRVRSLLWGSR
eukprot:SAG31_NODE_2236_length_6119_cov_15.764784_2_plen_122_part_00